MSIAQHLAAYLPHADGMQIVGASLALAALAVGLVGALVFPRALGLRATEIASVAGPLDGGPVEAARLRVRVRCKLVADVMLYREDGSSEMLLVDAPEHEARDLFHALTRGRWTAEQATDLRWARPLPERVRPRKGVIPFRRGSRSTRAA